MAVQHKPSDIREIRARREREAAVQSAAALTFVVMAHFEQLDNVTIMEHANLFPTHDKNFTGKSGTIVCDPDDRKLYRLTTDLDDPLPHSQPRKDRAHWKLIGDPAAKWPDWAQPLGAYDAYTVNDKVTRKGKRWQSTSDSNMWEPGVHGWEEVE